MGEQVAARLNGGVAQLGEHLPCKQGVKGSNPSISIACTLHNAPQELRSFGRVQARYETEYFAAYECKHSTQKIFVSQCTLKTAYKKYR